MSAVLALLGFVLLVFELVLIARIVLDWVGVLSPGGAGWAVRARSLTHAVTEPVIAPVRRVVQPVRVGSVSVDLAFTLVFIGVLLLRTLLVGI